MQFLIRWRELTHRRSQRQSHAVLWWHPQRQVHFLAMREADFRTALDPHLLTCGTDLGLMARVVQVPPFLTQLRRSVLTYHLLASWGRSAAEGLGLAIFRRHGHICRHLFISRFLAVIVLQIVGFLHLLRLIRRKRTTQLLNHMTAALSDCLRREVNLLGVSRCCRRGGILLLVNEGRVFFHQLRGMFLPRCFIARLGCPFAKLYQILAIRRV